MTEKFSDGFTTTLVGAITTTSRPIAFTVAATDATLAGGNFSIIMFDAGTDLNPTHAEILEVVDGTTTSWTASPEPTHTATTHAAGSTVKQILTRRSITQQMTDHTDPATISDPHNIYLRKATFSAKGDLIVGTGSGTFTREAVGADGTVPIADSTQTTGRRWGAIGTAALSFLTHMGDIIVSGALGAAARLGVGTVGQVLAVAQNSAVVTDPVSGPTCSANAATGAFVNGTSYDFAFAWSNGSTPDGGTTLPSARTTFVATSTGSVNVQAPAAPSAGLTLLVYAAPISGTLHQSATTLPNASTSTPNVVVLTTIPAGVTPSGANTTGGLSPKWTTPATQVSSVAFAVPGEFSVAGSPITSSGTLTLSKPQSLSALALTTGGTITSSGVTEARVAPTGAVTGVILQAGTYASQEVTVVNESVAANTVTFAASGTSNVANGAACVIPGLCKRDFIWDTGTSLWYAGAAIPGVFVASGGSHASGLVPDPGSSAGTTKFLREDASFAVPPTFVASGGSHAPGYVPDPGASAGTTKFLREDATFAIPASPAVFGASGGSHSTGVVPDPGSSAGTTRFLREDATFAVPPGAGGGGSGSGGGSGALVPIQAIGPLTANQATLLFTAPVTGFRNLKIVWQARGTAAATGATMLLQFNGDTGSNYDAEEIFGAGSSTASGNQSLASTSMPIGGLGAGTAPSGTAGAGEIYIPNYQGTTFRKQALATSFDKLADSGSNFFAQLWAGEWRSTAAIASITLSLNSGNFDIGSYACLYGEMDTAGILLTPASNLLSETILTSSQSAITIANIPQGYRDLELQWVLRGDNAGAQPVLIQFNGDTGSNYDYWITDSAGNGSAQTAQTAIRLGVAPGTGVTTAYPSSGRVAIPGYTGTVFHKSLSSTSWRVDNSADENTAGLWHPASPAAITSIRIVLSAGNCIAGSEVRLYGSPQSSGGAAVGTGTRLRLSGNQSITTATATTITWDTEDNDADNQHYTSASALTGTVTKTSGSNVLVGSSTLFTTELSIGQIISVPGTATEVAVVIAITDATHLTVAGAGFANTNSGQTATRVNSAVVFRQPGFYTHEIAIYSAALSTGNTSLQLRLNGSTIIGQSDVAGINASSGYDMTVQRQFQQWDYVEVLWTQNSGGSVNVLADERTHWSIGARPTVVVAIPYINIQDQKTSGTVGGSFTSGAWRTRTLNTVVADSAGLSSLASNQITLPPGTYRISASAPADAVNGHQARLQNITASTTILTGTSEVAGASAAIQSRSCVTGRFVLSATSTLELQHQCGSTNGTNGFGAAPGFGTEVYSVVEIWKEG